MKKVFELISRNALVISLAAVVLIMAVIFYFSAQNASVSSAQSGKITDFIIRVFYPEYDRLSRAERISARDRVSHYVRKTAHFTEYAALGFFLYLSAFFLNKRKQSVPGAAVSLAVGALYALSDEWHQSFVGGRSREFFDFLIDSAGVLAGVAVMSAVIAIVIKNKKKTV